MEWWEKDSDVVWRRDVGPSGVFDWLNKWEELQYYFNVNKKLPESGKLYDWLLEQRDRTKSHPDLHELLLNKITAFWRGYTREALEPIFFRMDSTWKSMYEQLKRFKQISGSAPREGSGSKLSIWYYDQLMSPVTDKRRVLIEHY